MLGPDNRAETAVWRSLRTPRVFCPFVFPLASHSFWRTDDDDIVCLASRGSEGGRRASVTAMASSATANVNPPSPLLTAIFQFFAFHSSRIYFFYSVFSLSGKLIGSKPFYSAKWQRLDLVIPHHGSLRPL